MKRSDGAMTTLRLSKSFMNNLVNMALGKTFLYDTIAYAIYDMTNHIYRCFLISTWNQTDFQIHFSTILDGQSQQIVSQYESIIWFLLVRNQNNQVKDLESQKNEFESRFGSKLRSENTCSLTEYDSRSEKKFPKNQSSGDPNDPMVQIILQNYNLFMKIDEICGKMSYSRCH